MMKKFLQVVQNRWFIAGGILVLGLLALADWRQVQHTQGIQKQINQLTQQAGDLQQKNADLLGTIDMLKSGGAAEKQAREQLNMKKPGEFVYSFAPQQQPGAVGASGSGADSKSNGSDVPNAQRWYNYFFRPGS